MGKLFFIWFLVKSIHLITETECIQYDGDLAMTEVIGDTSKTKEKFTKKLPLASLDSQK